jgi:hypothetical protein
MITPDRASGLQESLWQGSSCQAIPFTSARPAC